MRSLSRQATPHPSPAKPRSSSDSDHARSSANERGSANATASTSHTSGHGTVSPRRRTTMELGLSGKAAIVTGASKGLGRAIARELAGEGANVAICSRGAGEIEAAAEELRATGRNIYAQAADVTDPAAVTDFVER